jgi:hypothetical protein
MTTDTKTPKLPSQEERYKKAISIVDRERVNWEDAVTFINPKVGFRMRELIRIFRKNYWGVFDEPIDKNTNREKIWIHLAQSIVEIWVKNGDIDLKDIGFIARNHSGYDIVDLTRFSVRDYLERMYIGEVFDADERQCCIDGTVVWKTWEDNSSGKPVLKRKTVDLLNFYIDPTEENIQEAYRVTERAIMLPSQIENMSGWYNTEQKDDSPLPGSQILNRIDGSRRSNFGTRTTGEYRDVWECWGKIPRWLVEDVAKDSAEGKEEIDGHIVVSGLEAPDPKCHYIEKNTKKDKFGNVIKPYEEWRCAKANGRWYGIGPIERILALQEYLNTIVNIRISRSYVTQLGLFKIKKGKGITAQMLSKLPVNGAIQVQDMDDIQQFPMDDASEASYKDEEIIKYWAQQVSSAHPITSGDTMPASTSATVGAIANTNAKTGYTMFKEGMGSFIERWIDRHALPIIAKTVKAGDVFRIMTNEETFKQLAESIAVNEAIEEMNRTGIIPTDEELIKEIESYRDKLLKQPSVFMKTVREIMISEVDAQVMVTNEQVDTTVKVNQLIQMLQLAPEYRDSMVKDVYDLLGLGQPKKQAMPPENAASQPQQPQLNAQQLTTQAMQPVNQ